MFYLKSLLLNVLFIFFRTKTSDVTILIKSIIVIPAHCIIKYVSENKYVITMHHIYLGLQVIICR